MSDVPVLTLNNGIQIPQLGFGVFQVPPGQTEAVVSTALEVGYRSIDTAAAYQNEEGVGRAIASCGLDRDEIFVTTKLWNADHGYDRALRAFDAALARLGLDTSISTSSTGRCPPRTGTSRPGRRWRSWHLMAGRGRSGCQLRRRAPAAAGRGDRHGARRQPG